MGAKPNQPSNQPVQQPTTKQQTYTSPLHLEQDPLRSLCVWKTVAGMLKSILCTIQFAIIPSFMPFSKRKKQQQNNLLSNKGIVHYSYPILLGENYTAALFTPCGKPNCFKYKV